MSALAVAPSPALITAQLFAAAPADTFEQMANGAVAAGSADVKVTLAAGGVRRCVAALYSAQCFTKLEVISTQCTRCSLTVPAVAGPLEAQLVLSVHCLC